MTVIVRPARRKDHPVLAAVGGELQELHATARPDVFRRGVPPLSEEVVAAYLAEDPPAIYVAEQRDAESVDDDGDDHAGRAVGYMPLSVRVSSPYEMLHRRVIATVGQIGVLASERGRGRGGR